jgi:hypothetical protein
MEQIRAPKRKKLTSKNTPKAKAWGSIDALRKLHFIAVFIRSSANRNDSWLETIGQCLGIDNATRWNSWYKVIDIAIKHKGNFLTFLSEHEADLHGNILTGMDWEMLQKTLDFLQPFNQGTLSGEKDSASLISTLETMDIILAHFEEMQV